ncbi:MAG: pyrroline-5-carboxylate reductase family protein [Thermoanaerobaculaceae bacterium]
MSFDRIGFVGGGRVTRFMLSGWRRAGAALPPPVVADPDPEARAHVARQHPEARVVTSNLEAARCRLVFLSVHPPVMGGVLAELREVLAPEALVVSLAPKVTLARLSEGLGERSRLARAIPNAPSLVGRGLNPVTFMPGLDEGTRDRLLGLLRQLGGCPEVPEETLEAYAILAAMGPTYFWPQVYELVDLGVSFGLERKTALTAVVSMLDGAARTMADSGLDEAAVMDLVPVHPLREQVAAWRRHYREVLAPLHAKLRS